MHRSVNRVLLSLASAVPLGAAWGVPASALASTLHAQPAVSAKKYAGPTVNMRWGPVKVTVYIKGNKITNVKATVSPDTNRSQMLDDMSLPILKQEVLQAQSASIDTVSGATMTSGAYIKSLQKALKAAKFKSPSTS